MEWKERLTNAVISVFDKLSEMDTEGFHKAMAEYENATEERKVDVILALVGNEWLEEVKADIEDNLNATLVKLAEDAQVCYLIQALQERMHGMRDWERLAIKNDIMDGYCNRCGTDRLPCFCVGHE